MNFEEFKNLVATSATICTMIHMLSGVLICRQIYMKKSSEKFDVKPFAGGIGMGIIMLEYAFILNDPAMINVNLFGLFSSIIYVAVFYIYASNKGAVAKLIGKIIGIAAIILIYAHHENPEKIEFRYGLLVTVLFLLLIATPLMNLGKVLKTKSTEILPFPLIVMGTIVSFQWALYGFLLDNSFIILQNIVGFLLYIVQLSLFAIFPSKPAITSKADSQKSN